MLEAASVYDPSRAKRDQEREKCGLVANLNGCKFPIGMIEICRKDFFTKNYNIHAKHNSNEYDFYPRTWILPREFNVFQSFAKKNPHPAYILKPANGAMGMGIRLYRHPENVPASSSQTGPWIVQEYIDNPLLIDGYKCDLRVYVLITSCCPLRIFVYNEGLVRLSAEKYCNPVEPHGESVYRHLTNYALNKKHRAYVKTNDESEGSKRSFAFLEAYLRNQMNVTDPQIIWRRIRNLIVKTIILGAPHIYHGYRLFHRSGGRGGNAITVNSSSTSPPVMPAGLPRESAQPMSAIVNEETPSSSSGSPGNSGAVRSGIPSAAFEILGFDILLDRDLRPWLIEVNRSPSFGVDQGLDVRVKSGLLKDALNLINIRSSDKRRSEESQKANAIRRLLTPTSCPVINDSKTFQPNGTLRSQALASDWLKSPKELLHRIAELKERLRDIRHESEMECFENSHCGNWRRVYPTMDSTLEQRYGNLLVSAFTEFNKGRPGEVNQVIQVSQSGSQQEDDLQQQLDYLVKEAVKLFQKDVKTRRKKPRPQPSPASRCLRVRWRNQSANSRLSDQRAATSVPSTSIQRSASGLPPTPFWDDPDAVGNFDSSSSSSGPSSPATHGESRGIFEDAVDDNDLIFGGCIEVEEVNFSRLCFRKRFSAVALRRRLIEQRALESLRGFADANDEDVTRRNSDEAFPVKQRYKGIRDAGSSSSRGGGKIFRF